MAAKLNQLDQGFLDSLEGFSSSARKAKNDDLAGAPGLDILLNFKLIATLQPRSVQADQSMV